MSPHVRPNVGAIPGYVPRLLLLHLGPQDPPKASFFLLFLPPSRKHHLRSQQLGKYSPSWEFKLTTYGSQPYGYINVDEKCVVYPETQSDAAQWKVVASISIAFKSPPLSGQTKRDSPSLDVNKLSSKSISIRIITVSPSVTLASPSSQHLREKRSYSPGVAALRVLRLCEERKCTKFRTVSGAAICRWNNMRKV